MIDPATTTLEDSRGQSHIWRCTPFGTREAIEILAVVSDIVLGGGNLLDRELGDEEGAALASLFAAGMTQIPKRLLAAGGAGLIARILSGCERSMVDAQSIERWQSLRNDAVFDAVGRGNLREVLHATWWVLEVNYGPLFADAIAGLGALSPGGPVDSDSQIPPSAPPAS